MEKKLLHIYTLTEEKTVLKYSTAYAKPLNPTIPLWKNHECTVKGFSIRDLNKIYKKKIWYQTDNVFILTERDDRFAYKHFIMVREKKSSEMMHKVIANERMLDALYTSAAKGLIVND